jgi:hypothetical protein
MAFGCGVTIVKYILFAVNFIFFVSNLEKAIVLVC